MSTDGHTPLRVWILASLMVLLWAVNFLVAKVALRHFPPMLLAALRLTLAGAVIAPIYLWKRRSAEPLPREPWLIPRLIAIGVFGIGLNQMFFTLGIGKTSVAHAALIIALGPVFAFLISAAVGQEQLSARKASGLAVAFIGVALLQRAPEGARSATPWGDFLIFLAGFTFSAFAVASKSIRAKFDSLTMTSAAYAGSGLVLLPVTLWYSQGFSYASVSFEGWAAVAYMALVSSLLCYAIFYYAMHYMTVTRLSAFAYLQPVFATGLAIPLLGESLNSSLISGGVLVLFGVFLTERS